MPPLAPCPRCERHVRTSEPSCPFCGKALSQASWVGAAAIGLAVLASGCPTQREAVPAYGMPQPTPPPTLAPPPAPSPQPSPTAEEGPPPEERPVVPAYGAPAPDPSPEDLVEPPEERPVAPAYGAPEPR